MQVARKLTLPLALSAFAALGVSAWLSVREAVALHHDDIERDQGALGRVLLTALAREQTSERREVLLSQANAGHLSEIRLVPLTEVPPDHRAALARGAEVFNLDVWRSAETWLPTALPDGRPGALWIREPLDAEKTFVSATISRHVLNAVVLGALWAVIAIGLGAVIVGRPLAAMAAKARRVSRGDYRGPVTLTQRDEIGELAAEMNRMCDELLSAAQQLRAETTAREHAQEQLRHADRLTTVGLLAAGIAHEMGTPLNVVSMRARMISTGEVTGDDARRHAEIIHEQTGQMTRIIRQLLDFARRSPPTMGALELRALAEQVLSMLAPLAEKRGCRLELAPGPAVELSGDHHRLTQVLTNLVINSVQAMPRGGPVVVSVSTTRVTPPPDVGGPEAGYARVDVRDEGEGIAPEILPRLFEPFFTTKPVGDGNGLGLPVAWGILRDHHGWIAVESKLGAGTTFSLFLPLEQTP